MSCDGIALCLAVKQRVCNCEYSSEHRVRASENAENDPKCMSGPHGTGIA